MNRKQLWKTVFLSWYWTGLAIIGMILTLALVGFFFRRIAPPAVIPAIGGLIVFSCITFVFSEILVNLLMRAKTARIEEYPDFIQGAEELFKKKRMWVYPRLYILDIPVPNAMAYGMGLPGFSAIAITQGLYELLSKEELKAVIAHELAHIRCKDVGILSTIGIITGSVEKLRQLFLNGKTVFGRGPVGLFLAGILWVVSKVLLGFLRAAISQERELAADALGASYIGSPDPLISALQKLASTSKKSRKYVVSDLMISHPGMEERIDSLSKLKG